MKSKPQFPDEGDETCRGCKEEIVVETFLVLFGEGLFAEELFAEGLVIFVEVLILFAEALILFAEVLILFALSSSTRSPGLPRPESLSEYRKSARARNEFPRDPVLPKASLGSCSSTLTAKDMAERRFLRRNSAGLRDLNLAMPLTTSGKEYVRTPSIVEIVPMKYWFVEGSHLGSSV